MKQAETPAGAGRAPNLMNLVEEWEAFVTNGLKLSKQQELGMENVPIFIQSFKNMRKPQLFSLVDSSSLKWMKEVQLHASHEEPLFNRCLSAWHVADHTRSERCQQWITHWLKWSSQCSCNLVRVATCYKEKKSPVQLSWDWLCKEVEILAKKKKGLGCRFISPQPASDQHRLTIKTSDTFI